MRKLVITLALMAAAATPAVAAPVDFATFITLQTDVVQSQFTSPVDSVAKTYGAVDLSAESNLSEGKLRVSSVGTATTTNAGTNTAFYDTLTFDASAFTGAFGATYDLELSAHFEGEFEHAGPLGSFAGANGLLRVYDGSTVIDADTFDDIASFGSFLGGTPSLCAQFSSKDFTTSADGPFSFDFSCTVTVSAANPTIKIVMNLATFINGAGSPLTWDLNMLNSGTLTADFGGRLVTSASGAFPGTQAAAPAPEPATFGLVALGLLGVSRARRKR